MIKSNAKSLLDNTAMLYKQTESSRHDVCLDQRSGNAPKSQNLVIGQLRANSCIYIRFKRFYQLAI